MKRKYTRRIFRAIYAQDTGMSVGFIYNKSKGCLEDVIEVYIRSLSTEVIFHCRLDEAIGLAAGLNKIAAQMLIGQLPTPAGTLAYLEAAQ